MEKRVLGNGRDTAGVPEEWMGNNHSAGAIGIPVRDKQVPRQSAISKYELFAFNVSAQWRCVAGG